MIIVNLKGGLGNQMFQYAYGYTQSKRHNTPLYINLNWFKRKNRKFVRKYELNSFQLSTTVHPSPETLDAIVVVERKLDNPYKFQINPNKITKLAGFWIDERYFKEFEDDIRKEFTLRKLSSETLKLSEQIRQSKSVSLHFRGKDKLAIPNVSGICTLEYYASAIRELAQREKDLTFYIFSDDITTAREKIKTKQKTVFVSPGKRQAAEDIYLMSCCDHNIIANSTFSWWGAWLNDNKNKIIIFPEKWMNKPHNMRKFIPEDWFKRRQNVRM